LYKNRPEFTHQGDFAFYAPVGLNAALFLEITTRTQMTEEKHIKFIA
jgi:hypothetical protein